MQKTQNLLLAHLISSTGRSNYKECKFGANPMIYTRILHTNIRAIWNNSICLVLQIGQDVISNLSHPNSRKLRCECCQMYEVSIILIVVKTKGSLIPTWLLDWIVHPVKLLASNSASCLDSQLNLGVAHQRYKCVWRARSMRRPANSWPQAADSTSSKSNIYSLWLVAN